MRRLEGKTKTVYFKGDTAREIRVGGAVMLSDSASVVPLRNDSSDRFIGVAKRNDTTSDSALVPIEVPVEEFVEWEFETDSDGGLADSDVGKYCSVDTVGGGSVNAGDSAAVRADISDTSVRQIFITRRISATKGVGVFATDYKKTIGDSAFG